jgi:hypothetical protein
MSISSKIPGMGRKRAGVPCIHLDKRNNLCLLWGSSERPGICVSFKPCLEFCGTNGEEALVNITRIERETTPR